MKRKPPVGLRLPRGFGGVISLFSLSIFFAIQTLRATKRGPKTSFILPALLGALDVHAAAGLVPPLNHAYPDQDVQSLAHFATQLLRVFPAPHFSQVN